MIAWLVYTNIGPVLSRPSAICQYMDKSSYRNLTLLYSRYVIWYQTIVLTGVFIYCWLALVTFASFCLVVFCFVCFIVHHIMRIWLLFLICAGLINLKAMTVSIFHSTNITMILRWDSNIAMFVFTSHFWLILLFAFVFGVLFFQTILLPCQATCD